MIVLALESSTSSAKAILYDSECGVLSVETAPYPAQICADGVSDTKAVAELTLRLGAKAARGREVAAVALCGTWHNLAICGSDVRDPDKTYSWNFMAPSELCSAMRRDRALTAELYRRTGCMPHVTYPRQALLYLRENGMELKKRRFISQGSYLFYLLTGEYCETRSTMSGSGLLNIHSLEYDEAVQELLSLSPSQFGALCTYEDVRPLHRSGAALLGVQPGIPVVPAYPDGALNQISSCAAEAGKMTLSVGTSAAIRLTSPEPVLSEQQKLWCYYGVTGWMSGAATAGACNCINWYVQQYLQNRWSFSELEQPSEGRSTPVFLPFLFGERCPGWQDHRPGGFMELKDGQTVCDLYRGVQEGVLYHLYQCYEALRQSAGEPEEILVSGGILHSPGWTQMLADIFGREIACLPNLHASTMGAVILALHAAGAQPDIRGFREDHDRAKRIRPSKERAAYYAAQYERYLRWYERTGDPARS